MAKIELNPITSGYNPNRINDNFALIEAIINDELLSRSNPSGSVNQMDELLDMNTNRIINLTEAVSDTEAATFKQIKDLIIAGSKDPGSVIFSADGETLVGLTTAGMKVLINQTPSEILAALLTVDGPGSLLDSDTVDGIEGAQIVQKDADTGAALIPVGTTAERPSRPAVGMWRENSTTGNAERYDGADWVDMSEGGIPVADAAGTADALTAIFSPTLPSPLTDKIQVNVRALLANATTTPTLNGDTIVKNGNQPLAVGDIFGPEHILILDYNLVNTNWELLNPAVALQPSIGVNQTWQNVLGSRSVNTDFTNNTGVPIMVAISTTSSTAGSFLINGVVVLTIDLTGSGDLSSLTIIVPDGDVYRFNGAGAGLAWSELR